MHPSNYKVLWNKFGGPTATVEASKPPPPAQAAPSGPVPRATPEEVAAYLAAAKDRMDKIREQMRARRIARAALKAVAAEPTMS